MGGLLLCAECGALLLLMEVTGKATPLDFSLVITCLAMWSLPSFIATCKCWKLSCPHTQSPLSQPQMCSSFYHSNWLANLTPFTSTRWSMSLPSFLQLFLSIQTKILGKFPFLLSPALFSILRQVCSLFLLDYQSQSFLHYFLPGILMNSEFLRESLQIKLPTIALIVILLFFKSRWFSKLQFSSWAILTLQICTFKNV